MKKAPLHINKNSVNKLNRGFSLIEILVAFAIFTVFVSAIMRVSTGTVVQVRHSINNERATKLAEEALEAARNIRDNDFDNLTDGTYGLATSSSFFEFSGSSDTIGIFEREIEISTVNSDQKQLDVTITWADQASDNNSFTLTTYLTNWRKFVPPAGLTVRKVVINYFSSLGINDFDPYDVEITIGTTTITETLDTGTATESPAGTFTFPAVDFAPGTYTVSENPDSNYTTTFSGDCDAGGSVTLASLDAKICTITNEEKYASLTVDKVVVNNGAGTAVESDFAPYTVGTTTVVEGASTKFQAGTYTVAETAVAGYTAVFSGDCDAGGSVTLAIGDNKTCTITNTDDQFDVPTVTSPTATSIAGTTATLGANVTDLGLPAVISARGTCWATTPNPVTNCVAEGGTTTGIFTHNRSGFSPGVLYYYRGYATNAAGTGYSADATFTTTSWANPAQQSVYNASGANDGLKVQVQGNYAYVVRADGTPDFLIINVSNPASPSLTGSLSLTGIPTNIFVSGNYAYVSSQDDSQELQIIDISTPATPSVVGTFNASGTANANGVYVVGTTAYIVRVSAADNEFVSINVSTPATPVQINSLDLAATGYEIYVSGGYAYIASGANGQELQVVNVATPSIIGSADISGNTDAITVGGYGSYVFLGRTANVYIYNVSTPSAPVQLSLYNGAGTVNDIALNLGYSSTYLFFTTGTSNKEFEVINITNPSAPVGVGGLNLTAHTGIAYDQTTDRAIMVGATNASELIIIQPQ